MRKARYDLRKVVCPNSSYLGYSSNVAKPGYWITWVGDHPGFNVGRVLGRIAETDGPDCKGWLAVITLFSSHNAAGIRWIKPTWVNTVYEKPPAKLLAWITGETWVKNKHDIARIIAMSEHGTLQEQFIENRDNPDQAYNARPEYIQQFILK